MILRFVTAGHCGRHADWRRCSMKILSASRGKTTRDYQKNQHLENFWQKAMY